MATVTVVVPCYNVATTLQRAVSSVISQSHRPLEVLLIDDGSADETAALIRKFESDEPELIRGVFLSVNSGPSFARNAGWNIARGEYIAFLDADDVWHPRKLEILVQWLQEHPLVAMCGHQCIQYPGHEIQLPDKDATVSKFNLFDMLISNRFSTPAVVVKREMHQRFPVARKHAEDYELWLRIAAEIGPLYRIELPLAWYFKPAYGASGLSADLWNMELGELAAIAELRRLGHISLAVQLMASFFSLIKYSRRFIGRIVSRLF